MIWLHLPEMVPRLLYYLLIPLMLMTINSEAQVQFSIRLSAKEIGSKDELVADYIISGPERVMNFQPPAFQNWQLLAGPVISSEENKTNGVKVNTTHYTYFLQPLASGKQKLPGTSVEADNKVYHCSEVSVTVKRQDHVAGAAAGITPPPVDQTFGAGDAEEETLKPGEDPLKKIRANLFVKAIPSKKKVFAGEPLLIEYKLYTRVRSNSRVIKQPSFSNSSVADLITNVHDTIEVLNGKKFRTQLFRKVMLLPIQPGIVEINSTTVESEVSFASSGADLRDSYYDKPDAHTQVVSVSSEPLHIEVVAPPAGAENLAIGNFRISASVRQEQMPVNETNSLLVTVSGAGNFKAVALPEINWPKHLYHFDTRESDSIDKTVFPFSGIMVFEIPFEADSLGSITIPAIHFSYFDANAGTIRSVHSEPVTLTVTAAVAHKKEETSTATPSFKITYLYWLVGMVLLTGIALVIFRKRKHQPAVTSETLPQPTHQPVAAVPDPSALIEQLLLVQGDAAFYQQAAIIAKRLNAAKMGDVTILETVIRECETMLYTPIAVTSKKEVIEKLQAATA